MQLTARQRLVMTFTFFSMFFGAGNLIFPPFVGAQAGAAAVPALIGFIVSAVGLPILGVLAVTFAGGFDTLAGRVSPRFALPLGLAIILTIGPCFAIPRTATTSFEMMVAPLVPDGSGRSLAQLLYSLVFFAASFVFAQHPDKLSKVLGRFMGPLLLALIAVLFVACLVHGVGAPAAPSGDYAANQLARGFLDGYQTMDLLAALYFGIVISANIRAQHVDDEAQVRRETAVAGLGTGVLLVVIYGVLGYVGVVSGAIRGIDASKDTGATVLTNLTSSVFGPVGTTFLGVVFVIACLNVCTGLICTCATYFHERFRTVAGHAVSYRMWQILFTVFSVVVSNAGLSAIIKVSVPVLAALYPIAIVLVLLALAHRVFAAWFVRVYRWTVLFVAVASFATCVASLAVVFGGSLPWLDAALAMLPLQRYQLGWLVPAAVGVIVGVIDSVRDARIRR
ncbi:branched-chain amino acid transporter [Bifidobacterium ramosum]|uniref:Branched-chain amino acid transport system II carrier protein n=1 Tax=Bifidobacterium ramosum TaxID=1798158 RepID=A0A6L4X2T3_9BIFI|nr:branched-chain amino acid transport system II carrier protein [Bifidobacterium ramosum]KAB8289285.1 branched-chain amino acid transporter [Bifidobacterium ramosum]NEG70991.1 branched-chain amino acid transport system II carrier protein [Bifidobacterium ramosum]